MGLPRQNVRSSRRSSILTLGRQTAAPAGLTVLSSQIPICRSLKKPGGNHGGFRLKKLAFYQASIFRNCSMYFCAGTFQLKFCSMSRFCNSAKASRLVV